MTLKWLKYPLPRSLYGRAALILILPIIMIQLVVSIVFLQRHFEGVTHQMTRNISIQMSYLLEEINAQSSREEAQIRLEELANALEIQAAMGAEGPQSDTRLFYDLSGRAMIETLRAELDAVSAIDLTSRQRWVSFTLQSDYGDILVSFHRRWVSASNPHQLLVLMVFTGLLMTVIAYMFLRNQLRPIKKLAEAAASFGKGHNVAYRPAGAIEVRAAGNAFVDMRARLERQIEQRTRMLSGVSHDLRTPLTRLGLGVSMLPENEETSALKRDIEEMERLLNAFLDFARGDATEAAVSSDPVAIGRSAAERARRGGGEVEFLAVDDGTMVELRPMAMGRALDNLIGNALRYGTRTRVSVDIYDRAVRYRVEDDGPGIPPEEREAALQAFSRLEPGRNQNRGMGVGLGLTITADIARSHGGSLRLGESAALGGLQVDFVIAR